MKDQVSPLQVLQRHGERRLTGALAGQGPGDVASLREEYAVGGEAGAERSVEVPH